MRKRLLILAFECDRLILWTMCLSLHSVSALATYKEGSPCHSMRSFNDFNPAKIKWEMNYVILMRLRALCCSKMLSQRINEANIHHHAIFPSAISISHGVR